MDSSWRRNVWEYGIHVHPLIMAAANTGLVVLASPLHMPLSPLLTNVRFLGPLTALGFFVSPGPAYGIIATGFPIGPLSGNFPYGYNVDPDVH